jgi:hypothetical protein
MPNRRPTGALANPSSPSLRSAHRARARAGGSGSDRTPQHAGLLEPGVSGNVRRSCARRLASCITPSHQPGASAIARMMTSAPHAIREALTELHKVMLSGVNWEGRYTQDQIRVTLRRAMGQRWTRTPCARVWSTRCSRPRATHITRHRGRASRTCVTWEVSTADGLVRPRWRSPAISSCAGIPRWRRWNRRAW